VGDVTIDATAAIAPGVVLQAASGSRIVVSAGVCLAAGVCVQSRKGVLTLESGASLGANVLVIGNGRVGENACISAGTTLINPTVAAEAILPPDSLIGSEVAVTQNGASASSHSNVYQAPSAVFNPNNGHNSQNTYQPNSQTNGVQSNYTYNASQNGGANSASSLGASSLGASSLGGSSMTVSNGYESNGYDRVYGRNQISQLISTLFPHRQPLDDDSSS